MPDYLCGQLVPRDVPVGVVGLVKALVRGSLFEGLQQIKLLDLHLFKFVGQHSIRECKVKLIRACDRMQSPLPIEALN